MPIRVLFSGPYLIHKTLENAVWLDSLHWRNVPFISSTVILTLQSMCGISMLPSHSPEVRNSQEFKDSQELIFNPSEFLKSLRHCKLSSLYIVHIVHVVHWEMGPVTACADIASIWGFYQTRFEFSPLLAVFVMVTHVHCHTRLRMRHSDMNHLEMPGKALELSLYPVAGSE